MKRIKPGWVLISVVFFLIQITLWQKISIIDQGAWVDRVAQFKSDYTTWPIEIKLEHYSGHPGMAAIVIAAGWQGVGASPLLGLQLALASILATVATAVAYLTKILRPRSWWWVAASGMIVLHPLYPQASPTNAVFAATVAAFWLALLGLKEQRDWRVVAGLLLGLAAATRFSETFLLLGPAMLWLSWHLKLRRSWRVAATGIVTWLALDPLLWLAPKDHIAHMLWRTQLHAQTIGVQAIQPVDFLLFSPLVIFALALAIYLLIQKKLPLPMAPSYLLFLLGSSLLASSVYLQAQSQSLRYFLPLIFVWESFLPLLLLSLVQKINFAFAENRAQNERYRQWLQGGIALLLVGSNALLLLHYFSLPDTKFIIEAIL
jgi:hypothetical protein